MSAGNFLFGALTLAGLVLVGSQLRGGDGPPPAQSVMPVAKPAAEPAAVVTGGLGEVTLTRSADSHFYADAQVNGTNVRFLVDTGASSVVLTREDAERAGIGAGDYSARGIGAGGEVRLMPSTANRLALGPIAADNVPVMVAEEGGLPVSLLGQSFLSRVASVTIERDRLVLR
jgi:aspartyl protease family protein